MQKIFNVTASSIYPPGVRFVPEGLHVSTICEKKTECGILLYDRKHKNGIRIPFPEECRKGNVYAMLLCGYQDRDCSYLFYQGNELYQDPYAQALVNERKYGETKDLPSRCKVPEEGYDWENDRTLAVPFEESLFYLLHVRGFTKHRTSGVHAKGTYAGITEKIPYLRELGVTAVLLMPSYEFHEILQPDVKPLTMEQAVAAAFMESSEGKEPSSGRINYWGYQEGLYFLPKYAYSYSKDAVTEFKDMVKALHRNGIEVMMQFYFPPHIGFTKILDILKHWVLEYHIDGFQLMGMNLPLQMLCEEPLFAETKFLSDREISFPAKRESGQDTDVRKYRNFGFMNEAFLYDMRKLLKGDADMIGRLIYLCRRNEPDKGIVNYIARQDGFRLADLVSYERKHNEANGESNQDGSDYNYSWNCGVEGKTKKKNILSLRMRQMKNALAFVLLSQGTPMIYSGDEFGNSQGGNNNPYCQDNPVNWIKWNLSNSGQELLHDTKELIRLRKEHSILHTALPLRGTDYISCGYPDISFHGRDAWRPETGPDSRSLGILYCGRYGEGMEKEEDTFLYLGINMHWEPYTFGLPQMPRGREWVRLYTTGRPEDEIKNGDEQEHPYNILVPPRTIVVYGTRSAGAENKKGKGTEQS
ncbi:MAG: alpha-amylase family glycosyl hydrolase [Blautia sp.]|nr:alpha-amylase family glycosyl hydrolase [Blautia sp.]MCM1200608.1 alpha-amylase family glycosyl hydrolase [Bacteroides fragilis]